ncbi:MAG: hypothetical protein KGR24_08285 [Planctomycetes bacterium]|nr:hypothetical protein [Planctomycetota bacterium]
MTEISLGGVSLAEVVLLAQSIASGAMCGLIWFVQIVHYPLFAAITGAGSREHATENQRRTSPVVIPFMAVELATAVAVAVWPPTGVGRGPASVGLALVAVIWLSTFFVQVPLHGRLAREGHSAAVVGSLVRSNWIRTIAWTARAILAAWMLRVAVTSPSPTP